jgi:NAD(P)-dependent dehydrogenase (short-subunit alcohol dehydrogenase family)
MLTSFDGRTAVVTGAASGIGLALSTRLASEGMSVVMVDIDRSSVEGAARSVGPNASALVADVSDAVAVRQVADEVFEQFGGVHLLCNNAGVTSQGRVWEHSSEQWDVMVGVNLRGIINGIQAFVPRMLDQPEGHIVNTSSIAGIVAMPGFVPYCVTKRAILALSEGLWHDLRDHGSKLGVTVLLPGSVNTRLHDNSRRLGTLNAPADPIQARPSAAIGADEVADTALAAIQTDRFYAFTHHSEEWNQTLRHYFDAMLDGKNPTRLSGSARPNTNDTQTNSPQPPP